MFVDISDELFVWPGLRLQDVWGVSVHWTSTLYDRYSLCAYTIVLLRDNNCSRKRNRLAAVRKNMFLAFREFDEPVVNSASLIFVIFNQISPVMSYHNLNP